MGSWSLSLAVGLTLLLIFSGSEAQTKPEAFYVSCPKNSIQKNSAYCECQDGFLTSKGNKIIYSPEEQCEDIDECEMGLARCKEHSYCRNRIGGYVCSCLPFLNWVAGIFTMDYSSCYESPPKTKQPSTSYWDLNNTSREHTAREASKKLQQIEQLIWNESLNSPGKGQNALLGIVYETKECSKDQTKIFLEAGSNTMDIDCVDAYRRVPKARSRVALITYHTLGNILNGSFFMEGKGLRNMSLGSQIMSGTIGLETKVELSEPVLLTFRHTQANETQMKHICVYWEKEEQGGSWSTQGCTLVGSNDSYTTCECYHLSSFAVLVALSPKVDPVLTAITNVGLSLSLLCLLLAVLTFFLCKPIQNTGTFIHLQLSLCLFLAHLIFLTGISQTEPRVLCSLIAGLLHYLYLASFTWMLLEGLHLYLTIRNLKVANYTSTGKFKKRFMCPFGYGLPAMIVAVSAAVGYKNYGTYTFCWLRIDKGFIWSFMGPVAIIMLINLFFYFQILWILRSKISTLNKEVSTIQDTRVMTFKAISQLFILGCSWGIGFFMVEAVGETIGWILAYVFTIINVLQGVLLFLVHCVFNRQVRMEYKKWFCRVQKGAETESTDVSRSTTHTKLEDSAKPTAKVQKQQVTSVQSQSQTHIVTFSWKRTFR